MHYIIEIKKDRKWQYQTSYTEIDKAIEHVAAYSYYPDYPVRVVRVDGKRETVALVEADFNQLAKAAYERNKQAA